MTRLLGCSLPTSDKSELFEETLTMPVPSCAAQKSLCRVKLTR